MLAPGTLVTCDRDCRYPAAWHLFVVLGPAENDHGRLACRVQAISRVHHYQKHISTHRPFVAPVSELTPVSAYGLKVAELCIKGPTGRGWIRVGRDPDLPVTAELPWGTSYDRRNFSAVDDDTLMALIAGRVEALQEAA